MSRKKKLELSPEVSACHRKLNAILCILLRQINDEALDKWNKQDKHNMVKALINVGLENDEIASVVGITYGAIANIKSKHRKGKRS
ncbi:MAG: hypothetical protein HY514_00350 [Candidatus Aenigmarchaeota archaeon]|nr:hypothetical protein [Candidatus Aenigmarchaeota archaeon]